MSQRTLGSTRLISRGAISDGSQFEWETRTIVFVSLSPMIYMIIVGRLNADGALLIRLHSSFRLRSPPPKDVVMVFMKTTIRSIIARAAPI